MAQTQWASNASHLDNATDADGMLWDISNRLARSQIARHISANSSLRRQHQPRIHKPASTGNSPQNILRKNSASQHRSTLNPSHVYPPAARRRAITAATNNPAAESRPMTWHPHTLPSSDGHGYDRYDLDDMTRYEQAFQPVSHVHGDLSGRNRYYSVPCQQFSTGSYMHVPISGDWATEPMATPPSAINPMGYGIQEQRSIDISPHQFLPVRPSTCMQSSLPNTAATTPNVQMTETSHTAAPTQPIIPPHDEKDGPELLGMGLYDPPEKPSLLFGPMSGPPRAVNGRGLKLEDAWTPPEDSDDDSEDGDGEEEEEDDDQDDDQGSEQREETDAEPSDSFVPSVYGSGNLLPFDMSNKSFFFEDPTEGAMEHAAFRGMNMQGWNVSPHSWTS